MKKIFSLFAAVLMAVGVWAQDPDWSVTSFSGSVSNNSTTINEATWTLSDMTVGSNSSGAPAWSVSSGKWKFGSGKNQFWSAYTLSTDKFNSYNITKVEVGCYDNGGTESSVTVKQGDVTIGTETVSTQTTSNVETLSAASGEGGTLKIIFTSTKQASFITSIKVWYTLGGDAVHVESVSLDQHTLTVMETKTATLIATIAPANATNQNVSWVSSDPDVASVEKGVVKGISEGEAIITVKSADGNKTDECVVTVTPKTAPVGATFYESFDELDGAGGNDGTWSGVSGTYAWSAEDCDNEGWTTEGSMNKGAQCASIRKGTSGSTSISSGLTTPAIGVAGKGNVTFNAQSWGNDTGDFYVDIVGGGAFTAATGVTLTNNNTTAKVTLTKKSEWGDYDLAFTGLTSTSKFRFYMAAGKRGFLDEVAVFVTPTSYTRSVTEGNYGTICLPYASASVEGAVMYSIVGKIENGGIEISPIEGQMAAGTPYIFRATASTLTVTYTGEAFDVQQANGLVGNLGEEKVIEQEQGYCVIYDNKVCPVGSDVKVGKNRAYIDYNNITTVSAPSRIVMPGVVPVPTDIENHALNVEVKKVVVDGQMMIIRGGNMFDLNGHLVK